MAFLCVSCDDKPMNEANPFVGTWENDNGQWVFTETFVTVYYSNGDIYYNGTYIYDDFNITVTFEYAVQIIKDAYGDSITLPYRFENDILILFGGVLSKKT